MIGANRVAGPGRAEYPEPDDLRGVTRLAETRPSRSSSALGSGRRLMDPPHRDVRGVTWAVTSPPSELHRATFSPRVTSPASPENLVTHHDERTEMRRWSPGLFNEHEHPACPACVGGT
jgi:hypothetical protein